MRIDPRAWFRLPWPTLALGVVACAILIGALVLALSGTRSRELLATPAKPPAPLSFALTRAPANADLGAIQSKPLLHASRTFYVAPPPNSAPVAPPLPEYRLAGSFIVPNKPGVALLANKQSGVTRRVRAGDDVDGWRVHTVEAKRVLLGWQDQQREIIAQAAPMNVGLKRVPIQRQRVAAAGVQPLSTAPGASTGGGASAFNAGGSDAPRLYQPPPSK